MESKWSLPPLNGEKGYFCTCGEIAFVKDIWSNPRPENPTPCRECYLRICELRNTHILEVITNGTN